MKHLFVILIVIQTFSTMLIGQENQTYLFSGAGGSGAMNSEISYSIGEPLIATLYSSDSLLQFTQGFIQPLESDMNTDVDALKYDFKVNIFPNPVFDELKITIEADNDILADINVFNAIGQKIVIPFNILKSGNTLIINMDFINYIPDIYHIAIFDKKRNELLGNYKIVKLKY
jgi:hypothetical protein